MSWFKDLADSVQQALPALEKDALKTLEKLTLTTPELSAERQRLEEEERRKEAVRNMLAGMMPWETRDSERDILVEECREAILQLSTREATFFGPYAMPEMDVKTDDDDKEKDEGGDETKPRKRSSHKQMKPSPESLEKLAKLEPLPPLLQQFDLDAHVGLIGKLLAVDPKLVEMQAALSGRSNTAPLLSKSSCLNISSTFAGGGERE
jgi:hypothetical protein